MRSITATNRKVSWFFREDEAGFLDLSPDFQRRPVWRDEQSSYLIDTVLNGLPFPEVYVRSHTTPSGATSYQVIDGQQRLRALLEFARNDLELTGDDVTPRWFGKRFDEFEDPEKQAFWNYEVVIRELADASETEIRDLFRRLNINAVTLNDQELRHARYKGAFIKLMEDLAEDEWWTVMRIVNVRQVRRMEDVEYISELFIAVMAGPQDKKSSLDQYYIDFENAFPDGSRWERVFNDTRKLIESVLEQDQIRLWNGKSDFYTLFHVFSQYAREHRTFSSAERTAIQRLLARFRRQVDQAKRRDNTVQFPKSVQVYADAVSRAASDVARRALRSETLHTLINRTLN